MHQGTIARPSASRVNLGMSHYAYQPTEIRAHCIKDNPPSFDDIPVHVPQFVTSVANSIDPDSDSAIAYPAPAVLHPRTSIPNVADASEQPVPLSSATQPCLPTKAPHSWNDRFHLLLFFVYSFFLLYLPGLYRRLSGFKRNGGEPGVDNQSITQMENQTTFESDWDTFLPTLVKHWQLFTSIGGALITYVPSVELWLRSYRSFSGTVGIFQLPGFFSDPVGRCTGFLCIVCSSAGAGLGILFYIHKQNFTCANAMGWEPQNLRHSYWNIWVLLALPGVWIVW